jgi:hypothetical protein
MPDFSGGFAGKIKVQTSVGLTDQPNHDMSLGEVIGTQKSSDARWNGGAISYWGVTDLLEGKGTQTGYFTTDHGNAGRDFGTFEGKVTTSGGQFSVEGSWKFTGGTGEFKELAGGGTFKTKLTSPTDIDCSWQGTYQLARAHAMK